MTLTQSEIALFYKLWYGLVWGINEKHKVIPKFKKPKYGTRVTVSTDEFAKIRDAMWENPEWIDDFLAEQGKSEFSEQEQSIIVDWRKNFIKGKFFIVRHLTKYSVFMTMDQPELLYGVCGITDSLKDFLPYSTPYAAECVLLPFGGRIIYDSLIAGYNVTFGSGITSSIKDSYNEAKEKYGIIEVLDGKPPVCQPPKEKKEKKATKSKPAPSTEVAIVPKGVNVPKAMAAKYNEISEIISQFCDEKLNDEYKEISLRALAKLCRKRPSPLEKGRARTWACGIVYAIGSNNFLFDKSQPINMKATEIAEWFGLAKSTAGNKASEVAEILDISFMNTEFSLRSMIDSNPAIWYLSVNGYIADIRDMPREAQEEAFRKGLITYIPADRC